MTTTYDIFLDTDCGKFEQDGIGIRFNLVTVRMLSRVACFYLAWITITGILPHLGTAPNSSLVQARLQPHLQPYSSSVGVSTAPTQQVHPPVSLSTTPTVPSPIDRTGTEQPLYTTAEVVTASVDISSLDSPNDHAVGFQSPLSSLRQFHRVLRDSGLSKWRPVREIRLSVPVATGIGAILAFNSGYLNGCCLSGMLLPSYSKPQSVVAVTGALTTSALGWASPAVFSNYRSQLGMVLSYGGGSFLAGMLNPHPVPFQLAAATAPTLALGSWLLYRAASRCGIVGSDAVVVGEYCRPFVVFGLVAAASGLQNSLSSVHSANLIRSAHFSGITSDTGTFLGQVVRGNRQNLYRVAVNSVLLVAFGLGGFVSLQSVQALSLSSLLWSARLLASLAAIVLALQLL
jgi:Protein of unknown function (DUF1275)